MLFQNETNIRTLAYFIQKAEAAIPRDASGNGRLEIAKEIAKSMHTYPKVWDERCTFNIKHIGNQPVGWAAMPNISFVHRKS